MSLSEQSAFNSQNKAELAEDKRNSRNNLKVMKNEYVDLKKFSNLINL